MSENALRADINCRPRSADSWDAGIHAESQLGAIDLGLAVEPDALGLILDAPGIGRLRLAFDLEPQGKTLFAQATRQPVGGRETGIFEPAASRTQQHLRTLEDRLSLLESERDEARDRASVLADERAETAEKLTQLQDHFVAQQQSHRASLREATATLEIERAGRLAALAENQRLHDTHAARLQALELVQREGTQALQSSLDESVARIQQLEREADGLRSAATDLKTQIDDSAAAIEAWQEALAKEQAATEEARQLARQFMAQVALLTGERDEARAVARQLHQKLLETA